MDTATIEGFAIVYRPIRSPLHDLDPEEAITAWDMVAAGFSNLAGFDVEKTQGKVVKPFLYEILVNGTRLGLDVGDFRGLAKVVRSLKKISLGHYILKHSSM